MFQTPEFWVLVAFVLLIVFLGKRVYRELSNVIDDRTAKIQKQLQDAQRLHDEALSLLQTYQKKHEDAMQQAIDIVSRAESDAIDLKRSVESDLEEMIRQKEKSTLERIEIAQETAGQQLKDKVASEALSFVEEILHQELKNKSPSKTDALKEISEIKLDKKVA